ncbi:DNA protection during starvation protein [compost metagenome]
MQKQTPDQPRSTETSVKATPLVPQASLYDVEQIRRDANEAIDKGPVTADYPLDLHQAYKLLNQALASEILCVLRYRHHQIVAKGIDNPQVADEFEEHAEDEQRHMMMIATRIDQLGGDPDLNPATIAERSATKYGKSCSLGDMIKEDLVEERVVIEIYRRLIAWFGTGDPTTRRMFESILKDEEDHANDLANLLSSVNVKCAPQG